MSGVGSGDKLARGANRATYSTTEGGVSEQKWNDMFSDFNAEEFKNAPNQSSIRTAPVDGSDADVSASGDAGTQPAEVGDSFVEVPPIPEDYFNDINGLPF